MDGSTNQPPPTPKPILQPDPRDLVAAENARCALAGACEPGDLAMPSRTEHAPLRRQTNLARLVAARTFTN